MENYNITLYLYVKGKNDKIITFNLEDKYQIFKFKKIISNTDI